MLLALVLGVALVVGGTVWLSRVGALSDRSDLAVAVLSDENFLEFATHDGAQVAVVMGENCKRMVGSFAGRRCVEFLQPGDEVLLRYDTENPTHIWTGLTPGGGLATVLIYVGISIITVGIIALWYASRMQWRLRRLGAVGAAAGRAGGRVADRADSRPGAAGDSVGPTAR